MSIKLLEINKNSITKDIVKNDFGLSSFSIEKSSCNDVIISIIGTGLPTHSDLRNIKDFDIMTNNRESIDDEIGASTILGGIINSTNKHIPGLLTSVDLLFTKAIDKISSFNDYSSILSSIIWSIAKNANIIILPFIFTKDFLPFSNVIKKAYDNGVIILVPEQKGFLFKNKQILMSRIEYSEEYSISCKRSLCVNMPYSKIYSLYGDNSFIESSIEYASLGITASIISTIIKKNRSFSGHILNILEKEINSLRPKGI